MTKIARERKMREGGVGRMKPEFSRVDDGMIPHRKPTGAYALMAPITLSNLIGHALSLLTVARARNDCKGPKIESKKKADGNKNKE
jgi:hypothetical protein